MITIMRSGRTGNNLFQYAFGLAAAKKLNTSFVFDASNIEQYFELDGYNNFVSRLIRRLRYIVSLKFNDWKSIDLNLDIAPQEILDKIEDHTINYGYFQSEFFFTEQAGPIRKHFKFKADLLKDLDSKYGSMFNAPTVCVAIRMTDYADWKINELGGRTPELSFDYFKKALTLIKNIDRKKLIVISDDLNSVKQELGLSNVTYIDGEANALIALTLADELIISNSSFHWWGAWLNTKPNKVVYAPEFWLGHKVQREYPKNIIPADWIKVKV